MDVPEAVGAHDLEEAQALPQVTESPEPAEAAMPASFATAAKVESEVESEVTKEAGALMEAGLAAEAVQIEAPVTTDEPVAVAAEPPVLPSLNAAAARPSNGKPIRIRIGPSRSDAADQTPGTPSQTDVTHG